MTTPRLLVVTHTGGQRPYWMSLCEASIKACLPEDAEHASILVEGHERFAAARLESMAMAQFVAFVDDDDLVVGDPFRKCLAALDANPTAGVAFTDEEMIDFDGNPLRSPARPAQLKYSDFLMGPSYVAHHVCVYRTAMVDVEAIAKVAGNSTNAVEWLMAAHTAFVHGAVHVPELGYQWRQHQDNKHKLPLHREEFMDRCDVYRSHLRSIPNKKMGPIPVFKPN